MHKKDTDRLPIIISVIATIIFVTFAIIVSRPKEIEGLESGNIQHAIETGQE